MVRQRQQRNCEGPTVLNSLAFDVAPFACRLAQITAGALFVLVQALHTRPGLADEGIYYLQARIIANGTALPYVDFFSAHPVMHLASWVPLSLLVGPTNLLAYKVTLNVLTLATALVIGLASGRLTNGAGRPARHLCALVASTAVLFTSPILIHSSYDTGMAQAAFLFAISVLAAVKGRAVLAGGLAAWSTLTLLQVVPAFLLVVMLLLRRGRLLPFCVAWIGPVAAVTAVLSWATDGAYWRQTVSFHLAKVAISDGNGGSLSPLLRHDQVLLVLGLIACFVLSWRTDADTRWTAVASATSITINVLFFAQRPVVFGWYLVPLFLCLSILLGSAAAALFERSEHRAHTLARLAVPLLAGAVVLLAGERLTASSLGQPLPVASLEEIVSFLRARRQDDGSLTVFGDSSVTPWIALYAGVEVTQMHVDTNVQRFLTDPGLCARLTGVLENHPSTVIVTRDSGGIGTLPCFRTFLKTRYERVALFSDPVTNVAYQLFSLSR